MSAEPKYKTFYFKGSQVHVIIAPSKNISVHYTLKGHKYGVNCSYFNMNTRKTIPAGDYNRPFIVIKKEGAVRISDKKSDIEKEDKVASAGSWILRGGKVYHSNDHFTKGFRNMLVARTCIGIDKDGNVHMIVVRKANFSKLQALGLKLGLTEMVNVDGGTSTIMKKNGKIIVSSKRPVVNYVVCD